MRLHVAKALVGDPMPGNVLHMTLYDNTTFRLTYGSLPRFNNYIWIFDNAHLKLPEVQVELQKLVDQGVRPGWVTCYVDRDYPIVVGMPLHLALVMNDDVDAWPRIQTRSVVEFIVVK
jgi:hypothetical protein